MFMFVMNDVCMLLQNGYTALHIAAKKNQMDIVSTLVEHGARTSAESRVSVCLCCFVTFTYYTPCIADGAHLVSVDFSAHCFAKYKICCLVILSIVQATSATSVLLACNTTQLILKLCSISGDKYLAYMHSFHGIEQ